MLNWKWFQKSISINTVKLIIIKINAQWSVYFDRRRAHILTIPLMLWWPNTNSWVATNWNQFNIIMTLKKIIYYVSIRVLEYTIHCCFCQNYHLNVLACPIILGVLLCCLWGGSYLLLRRSEVWVWLRWWHLDQHCIHYTESIKRPILSI